MILQFSRVIMSAKEVWTHNGDGRDKEEAAYRIEYILVSKTVEYLLSVEDKHMKYVLDIISRCYLKYDYSCFLMIDDLSSKIIDKFFTGENNEK